MIPLRHLLAMGAALAGTLACGTAGAQAYVNATVGGELAPGVYGRINIGNASPPPLLYAQPVVIQPPAVVVPRSPIYMYVPPGHAKNWSKHCARYNACAQPVYFVKEPPRAYPYPQGPKVHREERHWDDRNHRGGRNDHGRGRGGPDRDQDRGHGKGHGHGRD